MSIQFNNPDLQKAFHSVEPDMKSLVSKLDRISGDIRKIEQWLQQSGFCAPVSVFLDSEDKWLGDEEGSFDRHTEYVEWGQIDGRWRLLYRLEVGYGGCAAICYEPYSFDDVERKPLIEKPGAIRLKADRVLPMVVEQAGKLIRDSD